MTTSAAGQIMLSNQSPLLIEFTGIHKEETTASEMVADEGTNEHYESLQEKKKMTGEKRVQGSGDVLLRRLLLGGHSIRGTLKQRRQKRKRERKRKIWCWPGADLN